MSGAILSRRPQIHADQLENKGNTVNGSIRDPDAVGGTMPRPRAAAVAANAAIMDEL